MKKTSRKVIPVSILILAIACSIGFSGASALSAEGESLLSGLISAGSTLGVDVGGIISSLVPSQSETASSSAASSGEAAADLDRLFAAVDMTFMDVTDLVYYLQSGGTFEEWMTARFGSEVEIPASVKEMPKEALVEYLIGTILYPKEETSSTKKYVFTASETELTTDPPAGEPTGNVTVPSDGTENRTTAAFSYLTGDVDLNGTVNTVDARLTLRAGASLVVLSETAAAAADVNGDGRVTPHDARSILRYAAGITKSF